MDKEFFLAVMKAFIESLIKVSNELFGIAVKPGGCENSASNAVRVKGGAVVVTFKGQYSGRMLISISGELLDNLSKVIVGGEVTDIEKMFTLNEFGNMVAGNSITILNNQFRGINLRLSPPSSFLGEEITFSNLRVSNYNVTFSVEGWPYEQITLNVALVN